MPGYEIFWKFYDPLMGDRAEAAEYLRKLIFEANPKARNVLELGCGTGSVLKHLARYYQVSGIDNSGRMLSIGRRKLPHARLHNQDMVKFSLDERFDVICCVFDSINHVTRFSGWKKVFGNVRRHLLDGGCFIFDINTQRKLDRLIAAPPWIHRFGKNLLIMDVTAAPRRSSNWNIRVFEHLKSNRYALHEENIMEVSFPPGRILAALRPHFSSVRVINPDRNRPSPQSERLFFVCKTC